MIYKQEAKFRELAKLLSGYDCIFMDTCSLMEEAFPGFMENLAVLKDDGYWNEQIIVLKQCVQELKKHAKSKEFGKRIDAKCALKILRKDQWRTHIIKIDKSIKKDTHFVDQILYNLVNEFRRNKRILIITQDKRLAYDLRSLNHLGSQRGRPVDVYKLRPDSGIEPNYGADENGIRPDFKDRRNYQKTEKAAQNPFKNKDEEPKTNQRDEPIVLEDRRLSANLRNPNYEKGRKIEDIDNQIGRLSALPQREREAFALAFTLPQLQEEKAKLLSGNKTVASREEPKAKFPPKKAESKETPKAASVPSKKEEKALVDAPSSKKEIATPKKAWTERGRNASFALKRLGEHHGWLFRDPSIPFVKGIHGDYDLVSTDLDKIDAYVSSMEEGEKKDLSIKSLSIHIEKDANGFILSKNESAISTAEEPDAKKPQKEKEPPAATPSQADSKPASKAASPKAKEKAPSPKEKEPAPSNTIEKPAKAAPASKKKERTPSKKVEGKSIEEGAPTKAPQKRKPASPRPPKEEKPEKAKSERKPRTAIKAKAVVSNDGNAVVPPGVTLSAGEPQPKKRQTAKDKPQSLEETVALKAAKKAETGKSVRSPASKNSLPKKKAEKGPSPEFEKAKKNDQLLKANISNPTYSAENKIRDIEAQLLLLKSLKKKEKDSLLLSSETLEARLKELRSN